MTLQRNDVVIHRSAMMRGRVTYAGITNIVVQYDNGPTGTYDPPTAARDLAIIEPHAS